MYENHPRWGHAASILIALSVLLVAGESWAGTVNAFITDGTFINSNAAGTTNGGCGYEVVGNSGNGTATPTLYGLFKDNVPYMRGRELVSAVTLNMQVQQYPGAPSGTPFTTCNGLGLAQGLGNSYQLCQINSSWTTSGTAGCEGHAGGNACAAGQPSWNSPDCSATGWSWTCLSGSLSTGTTNGAFYSATASCLNVGGTWCSAVQSWADGGANNGFLVWAPANRSKCYPQYFNKNMYITFSYSCRAGYDDRNGGGSGCGVYCDPCSNTGTNGGAACHTANGNSCSDSCGNSNPGWTCGCSGAWTGNNCTSAASCGGGSTSCVDKNECTFNGSDPCKANGDTGGTCSDIAAPSSGHNCSCSSGFSASNQGTSSATCVGNCPPPTGQSDPCSIGGTIAGTCSVTGAGTWNCTCPSGYVSTGGSHPACIAFQACNDTAHGAVGDTNCKTGVNGNSCTDLAPPSTFYTCNCATGYISTGGNTPSCIDNNECSTNHCVSGGDSGATCQDHVAPATGYDCTCSNNQFWTQSTVGGFLTCVDVNECTVSPSPFPCVNGTCVNVDDGGGYKCGCDQGYVATTGKTPVCVHPDSCDSSAKTACVATQTGNACVDNPPPAIGYTCNCSNPAYTLSVDGRSCVDKNACAVDHCGDEGDRNASCVDNRAPTAGYTCDCSTGWTFDGTSCVDVNECLSGSNPCGHGNCSNTQGSYQCLCNQGYASKGDPPTCVLTGASGDVTYKVIPGTTCGCRVGGRTPIDGAPIVLFCGVFLVLIRRRRRSS